MTKTNQEPKKKRKNGRGGARAGAGRPKELGEGAQGVEVYIDDKTRAFYESYGDSLSAGLRAVRDIIEGSRK